MSLLTALCRSARSYIVKSTNNTCVRVSGVRAVSSGEHKMATGEAPSVPKLHLYNSLTRKKELFVPLDGKRVLWYSCGPTVYDASHMGHARSYITFDILRRVMTDYFKYDVFYAMNITDIDDKIINKARQNYLLKQYLSSSSDLTTVVADVKEAIKLLQARLDTETNPDKKTMLTNIMTKAVSALDRAEGAAGITPTELINAASDPLARLLDTRHGAGVTDHSIFSALTRHWEEQYHADMTALNVLPPDVLTRVSEYVPEVVTFVENIIQNGYAYESNGSVYFDTVKFSQSPDHKYAKLVPEAVGDLSALAEGEGELSVSADRLKEKKNHIDFALWKASKPGEPAWPSPWGNGRPGWHIECSVMACDVLGKTADIHTGGFDLKFPHHDNEIAQVEAHYGYDQWITYFLHSGHLTIEGCKMSKSLKNFVTIREALQRYTSSQLRLAFLLHSWAATLDYSENTMKEAVYIEKSFNEFFLNVKDLLRQNKSGTFVESFNKWDDPEKRLNASFLDTKSSIHAALCDSVDSPTVIRLMKELVVTCNVYIADQASPNAQLLGIVASYLTQLFKMFGVTGHDAGIGFTVEGDQAVSQEELVIPYLDVLADFRERVRTTALEQKATPLLQLCDWLRDEALVELGVKLEDKKGKTRIKLVGKEALLKEREAEKQMMEEKRQAKLELQRKLETAQREREAQARIRPQDMFRDQTDKYSQFDSDGIPTHNTAGETISDKQMKKLRKLWQAQEKKHNEYLSSHSKGKTEATP